MSNLTDRLLQIIKEKASGKHTVFAKKAGIPASTMQGYISGRTPHPDHLIRIRETFQVNIDWLLSGEGDPYIQDQVSAGLEMGGALAHLYNKDSGGRTADEEGLWGKTKREAVEGAEFTVTTYGPKGVPGEKARSPGPEVAELLDMTKEIVSSDTEYALSLAANIRSFHRAMNLERKVHDHERRIAQIEQIKPRLTENIRKEDPQEQKEELIRLRAR